ncbi:lipoprotein-releasing system ATP-binding protein LolD [Cysteiniphilum litorale]|uniref:Lipoprotein-releasing system ATP-binding protein LolD n=1 Tax=Cysteiniphilum litorale TaxID=2056700 RepID=A0A8J2Z6E0_9GAMM|nr:lipoprotein-releasing system ATP-binding protein LolD [Cysteiniphilum litorale]
MSDIQLNQYAIFCEGVDKVYKEGKLETGVLHDIDLHVEYGQKVAILGQSGSGKTTLLNMLAGLDSPTKGQVYLAGKRMDALSANKRALLRNRHLGFIYQFHHLLPEFSALDNVMLPLMMRKDISKAKAHRDAVHMLEAVGLAHRIKHKPGTLSGGERQRVAIARALVTKPSCILADEPTGNLDAENSEKVLQLMHQLSSEFKTAFVVVTHDERFASEMDKVYRLTDGRIE